MMVKQYRREKNVGNDGQIIKEGKQKRKNEGNNGQGIGEGKYREWWSKIKGGGKRKAFREGWLKNKRG